MPHVLSNITSKRHRLLTLLLSLVLAFVGVVLAPAALAAPPDTPQSLMLSGQDRSAQVAVYYFSDATGVTFEYSLNGGSFQTGSLTYDPNTLLVTGTVTGLQNGTTYSIRVRARNADGVSPATDPAEVTPGLPSAPTINTPVPGDKRATVTLAPPMSNGGFDVTGYEVSVQTNPSSRVWTDAQEVETDGVLTVTRTGLVNGTTYYLAVRARNANGPGASSEPVAVTPGRPTAPNVNRVIMGDQSGTVSFSPPTETGGFDLIGYEASATVDASDRNWQFTSIADLGTDNDLGSPTVTVDGLSNGTTYNVYIRAVNGNGPGAQSGDGQTVTPDAQPTSPTNVVATSTPSNDPSVAGGGTAMVTFTPPVGGGGTNPTNATSYTATSSPAGGNADCSSLTSCSFTGLNNGTKYTFTVIAYNGSGIQSDPSAESNSVVPSGAPYAPRSIARAGASPQTATVSFLPPIYSGAGVLRYQLSIDNGTTWRSVTTRVSGARRLAVATGLRSGVRYTIRIRAVNALGTGVYSAGIVSLTGPSVVPGRPAARAGTSAALIRWLASRERDVVGYLVVSTRGARCYTYTRTETSCIIGNTAGVRTYYRVFARSASGLSYASAATNTVVASSPPIPSSLPGVPGGFRAVSKKVKTGKSATLIARGFLPNSSVVLVAYGAKRHVVKRFTSNAAGNFKAVVTMPKDSARSLTFVAFGVTPYASSKAIAASIRRG